MEVASERQGNEENGFRKKAKAIEGGNVASMERKGVARERGEKGTHTLLIEIRVLTKGKLPSS